MLICSGDPEMLSEWPKEKLHMAFVAPATAGRSWF